MHIEINRILHVYIPQQQDRLTVEMIFEKIITLSSTVTLHPIYHLTYLNHTHIFSNGNLDQFLVKVRLFVNIIISTLMTKTKREI